MRVNDYLSRDDIARFTARSDLHAWRMVIGSWLAIAAIFWLAATWTNPFTVVAAVVLLAGRMMGLSVLMHDCGHRTLFRTQRLNEVVGQWLCALPVLNDLPSYAQGHLEHHRKAGTRDDPDLPNYQAYPVSKESFRRKVVRDLTGQTGLKLVMSIARGASGVFNSGGERRSATPFVKQIGVQLGLFGILAAFGIWWAYLLWVIAFMTVFMLIVRVRQVAEHAAVPDLYDLDTRYNTRSVDAPWWQRWLMAPFGVNYHLEHHFMASVPCYHLKALRDHLRQQKALEGVPEFSGYGQLLRHVLAAETSPA